MPMSIRDAILATANPKPAPAEVDGWGTVYFRTLTVGQILSQQTDLKTSGEENHAALARALCRVLVNEDNTYVFNPDVKEDVQHVLSLPWQLVKAAMEQANKHNGIGVEAPKG
jgi:hypothetical protein